MRTIIQVIIISLFLTSSNLHADKMRIAIIDFQAKGVPETVAKNVSELIRGEMIDTGIYIVVERAQMNQILNEHEIQQTGCTDTDCAVKVGKLLSARKILIGTVMKMGEVLLITGRIIDVEKGVGEFSDRQEASSEGDLVRAMSLFTRRLTAKIDRKTVKPEQEDPPVYVSGKYRYQIEAGYNYITPFGDFKDLADTGMGGTINVSMDIIRNISVGLGSGYYLFSGKEEMTDRITIIPLLATVGYRYYIIKNFYVMPVLSGGGIYVSLTQSDNITGKDETESSVEYLLKGGVSLGYFLWRDIYIQLNAEYNTIIEKDGMMQFVSYNGGVGIRL